MYSTQIPRVYLSFSHFFSASSPLLISSAMVELGVAALLSVHDSKVALSGTNESLSISSNFDLLSVKHRVTSPERFIGLNLNNFLKNKGTTTAKKKR